MQIVYSALSFLVAIGVLVTVHEFGHFWVARRLGVKVLRFSIGFGRPLLSRRWGADQTEYVLAMIPFGGYVQMLDENEAQVRPEERHRAFNCQPLWKRIAVVVAGPAFNFLFAIVGYSLVFMVGISGLRALVGTVTENTIAAQAGLLQGQEITAVDGARVQTWEETIQRVIGASLSAQQIPVQVRYENGRERPLNLDLGSISIDDLTRGQFFDSLGLSPARPNIPPIIGELTPGGAAQQAGFVQGDRVISAAGDEIPTWGAWVDFVRARPGQHFEVTVERAGQQLILNLTPAGIKESDQTIGRIGAMRGADVQALAAKYYVTLRYPP